MTTPALPLADLTVLVTGEIPGLSRNAAVAAVGSLGGRAVSSVSSKVDLVVAGDGAGVSKMDKARLHGCAILTGDRFAALVTDPGSWDGQPLGTSHADWEAGLAPADETEPDEPPVPRPGDPDYVPMTERHLVGRVTDFAKVDGVWRSRFRLWCQCGHRWAEPIQHNRWPKCPVGTGARTQPQPAAPWDAADGGWVVDDQPGSTVAAVASVGAESPAPADSEEFQAAPVDPEEHLRDDDWLHDWDEPVEAAR